MAAPSEPAPREADVRAEPSRPDAQGRAAVVVAVILLALAAAAFWIWRRQDAARRSERGRAAASAGATPRPGRPGASLPPLPSRERPPAPAAVPSARSGGGVTVAADVPGASVFFDREYAGIAPVTVHDLGRGRHRLNVSAEGYDGVAETVEVTGAPQTIEVRLKEVRLDTALEVVHRHAMGSCAGRLLATRDGLRYDTARAEDAFTARWPEVEPVTSDYLKKTLRVKLKGGRTYNFGDPGGRPEPLFAFAQQVEKARSRM